MLLAGRFKATTSKPAAASNLASRDAVLIMPARAASLACKGGTPAKRTDVGRSLHRPSLCLSACVARGGLTGTRAMAFNSEAPHGVTDEDLEFVKRAAKLADSSAGLSIPHPNHACVLVTNGEVVAEAFLFAQGTTSAEVLAVEAAGEAAKGATAYLNLESGDCHGDDTAVTSLVSAGVSRVVIGLLHPLKHLHGMAVEALKDGGVEVVVLRLDGRASGGASAAQAVAEDAAVYECLSVNEALLHRTVRRRPFSVLKYAMTLDGKIATSQGHSAWVSCTDARKRVFEMRARSDAVIVGGNTVRRDNPRLTTRREGGHIPVRVVMSRTLELPEDANLWDTTSAPTMVMTQRGARQAFQEQLRSKGVEVIEFDFLSPAAVIEYCYRRGFMQCLWECGGMLAAPAISGGVVHMTMAFVAPKIIGGARAPTPVGELGFVEMTQAVTMTDTRFEVVGSDMLATGYLPSSGGLRALADEAEEAAKRKVVEQAPGKGGDNKVHTIYFYKSWDAFGALSNFSPHPIVVDGTEWRSVEHFYQGQKFEGVGEAQEMREAVAAAASPEEAARIGRLAERLSPHLVKPDWADQKVAVMHRALREKFSAHPKARQLLLSTAHGARGGGQMELVEDSPHDTFWGCGVDGKGANHLGRLLMQVRSEIIEAEAEGGGGRREKVMG